MELWVSSKQCAILTSEDICILLDKTNCQVYRTCSTKNSVIEHGFHIRFISFPENIKDLWENLNASLNVKCAFVNKYNSYQGCINNWPEVFVETKCSSNNCG